MKQQVFGLDITDKSAEIAVLDRKNGGRRLVSFGQAVIPPGTIERGRIVDADGLARTLARLIDDTFGAKRGRLVAGVSLPETVVYTKVFTLPASLTSALADKAVRMEAADAFPIATTNAVMSLSVVARNKETQDIFLAATESEVAREYLDLLRRVGITPLFFDTEAIALARALIDARVQDPVLIADIGARTTNLVVCDRGTVRMSACAMIGGDELTSAIERKRAVPLAEAEETRRKGGFDPAYEDGRLLLLMQSTMSDIISEIKRTVAYYEARSGRKIAAIALAGGVSLTPQIAEFVGSNMGGIPVVRGNPLRDISLDGLPDTGRLVGHGILWGTAIGLALRTLDSRLAGVDLIPRTTRREGLQGFLNPIKDGFTSLLSMVTRPKKPASSSKDSAPAEERAAPTASAASTSATAAPASAAPAAQPPAAVNPTNSDDGKDYGVGIGDILGNVATQPPVAAPASPVVQAIAPRRSIESILSDEGRSVDVARVHSKRTALPLTILALICAAAALAGIIMFVRKNGAPDVGGLLARFSPAPTVIDVPVEVPETVNAVVVLSTAARVDEKRPVLLSRVIETDVTKEMTFETTGEAPSATGKASGMVTIVNETSQPFTFVATTRVLSKSGVLFRMKSGSPIPVNGSVAVEVVADQPGAAGDIGPTTFTIPGLPPSLQTQVYAKSATAMTGGSGKVKSVSEEDIAMAKEALTAELKEEATANFAALLAEGEGVNEDLITSADLSVDAPEAGTTGASFVMKLSLRFRALLIPEGQVTPLLDAALEAAAPGDAGDFSLGAPLYTVQAYDSAAEMAEVRVEAPISKR